MSSTALQQIWRIPCDRLTPFEVWQIQLHEAVCDIRHAVNLQRRTGYDRDMYLSYLIGRLHGVAFAFSTLIIFQSSDYDDYERLRTAAMNECDFLTGPYLRKEA